MSDISDLLDMVERKGELLMRAQVGRGSKYDHTPRPGIGEFKNAFKETTEADHAEWERLYVQERRSVYSIAEQWGVSNGRVSHWLKKRKVVLRSQKEALRKVT